MMKLNKIKIENVVMKIMDNFSLSNVYKFILKDGLGREYIIDSKLIYEIIKDKGYQDNLTITIRNAIIYEAEKDCLYYGFIKKFGKLTINYDNNKDTINVNLPPFNNELHRNNYHKFIELKVDSDYESITSELLSLLETETNIRYIVDISSYKELKKYEPKDIKLCNVKFTPAVDNPKLNFINYCDIVSIE